MEQKIVFFDIDGTLLDDQKELPLSTRRAVKQLIDEGVYVAIATGRAPFMFAPLMNDLNIDTFISFNGQYVVQGSEVVSKNPLKRSELVMLEEKAKKNRHPMLFLDHEDMKANEEGHPHIRQSLADLKMEYPDIDPSYYHHREVYQALVFCEEKDQYRYDGKHADFNFIRWHDYSMDVIPAGGSKAQGIERLLKHLGIKKENTYAFGDALNDIEMLKFVGTGIAMGNAREEAKRAADFVTKSVSEDGILYGLQEIGLIK